eukprot:Hpha_TRINITY_DN16287_c1_g3::TRINITY_DN16287_c1_g3_i1::g.11665::m.11665/K14998/SURF1, SHY1; surfeit locus 1 family protein
MSRAQGLGTVGRSITLGLVGMTGCCSTWQLNRYFEKVQLIKDRDIIAHGPAHNLPDELPPKKHELFWKGAEQYMKVKLDGTFFNKCCVLVGPRGALHTSNGVMDGDVYSVIVPFVTTDGKQVAVSKGQVPVEVGNNKRRLEEILNSWPTEAKGLVGMVRIPEDIAGGRTSGIAGRHYFLDEGALGSLMHSFYTIYRVPPQAQRPLPYYVEVFDHPEGYELPRTRTAEDWTHHAVTPERHLGYLAFWSLSFAYGVVTIFQGHA